MEENNRLSRKCQQLEERIENLSDSIYEAECSINDSQQRSRRNNFELSEIPQDVTDDNLEATCISVLNEIMEVPITPKDVEACHRLPSKRGPKPVIIRMMSRKRTEEIIMNREKTKNIDVTKFNFADNNKIYINDNLSPHFKMIAYYCRLLKRKNLITKFKYADTCFKIPITSGNGWTRILIINPYCRICFQTLILIINITKLYIL